MQKVEISVYNGINVVATCVTSDCNLSIRVLKEFLDVMRYELDADSICVKKDNLIIFTISLLSHIDVVINGKVYPFIDGADVSGNMLADLWG